MKWKHCRSWLKLEEKIDSFVKKIKKKGAYLKENDKMDLKTTIITCNPTGRFNCSEDGDEVYEITTGEGMPLEDTDRDTIHFYII